MKKKIHFMCTAFRDGFQSVYGARVYSKDYLPVVKAAVDAGITHFEAGGGAMFQSPIFYSNENSFEIMDKFREAVGPDINLQTLARGVNVVGLDSQPREIIKLHADLFKKHGMTTIRNFDALNDVENLIFSGQCIHDAGLKHEVTVTMMELPPGTPGMEKAHTADFYINVLKKILNAGIPFSSIAFKDASGTSVPIKVFETIKRARRLLGKKVHIVFHSHETADVCISQYMNAIEAGADQVDLSLSPVSGGTCQPDVLSMWHALRGTNFDLDIDIKKIMDLEQLFAEAMKDYFMPPEAVKVEPLIPMFPMPGGALTANTQMMRDSDLMHKYGEVISNMGEAVQKGGFGTSVTPVSQFYFQQAFNNTLFGKWNRIADGYGKMVLGYFGKTPTEPDPEIVKIVREKMKLEPTTEKVVDLNDKNPKKGIKAAKEMLEKDNLPINDENIFIAAACLEKGIAFLKGNGPIGVRKNSPETAPAPVTTTPAPVVPTPAPVTVAPPPSVPTPVASEPEVVPLNGVVIEAPLFGTIANIEVKVGDVVKKGDIILYINALGMENPVETHVDGKVLEIRVTEGARVEEEQILIVVTP